MTLAEEIKDRTKRSPFRYSQIVIDALLGHISLSLTGEGFQSVLHSAVNKDIDVEMPDGKVFRVKVMRVN